MSISMQVIGLFPPPPSFSANYLFVFKDENIVTNMPNVIPMKTANYQGEIEMASNTINSC
ncbi:hypothetical protein EGR_11267 [Echinococcus granulosus]|uniref:Uncharacterized protein n=1 Tax=Echinococcus granulosus TaxID=6210 RepID=W6TYL5_ECHGR|nr:hypothetical protein EGR_11267 [Echinococcus granulosus]EUB53880.1 hypothetical protein EGR_11267 [Echinococcus granulosus]